MTGRAAARLLTVLLAGSALLACQPAPIAEAPSAESAPGTTSVAAEPESSGPRRLPDEQTTGVPDGVRLTPVERLVVTEDGTVIEGLEIRGGVQVEADDVTIRNSHIIGEGLYAVRLLPGHARLRIEDSEITGPSLSSAAVCCASFSLIRVNLHDVPEGPRANGDVLIEDSYIHHLVPAPTGHQDVIQSTAGIGIVIRGNNLQAYNPETGDLMNAVYQFGTTQGPMSQVVVERNFMNGGNYTINGKGGGTQDAVVTFRGNRLGRDHRYGPVGGIGPGVSFDASNVWDDTGRPVLGG